jgi:WD40 repeat protein
VVPWSFKIADLDLAKRLDDGEGRTASGALIGTPSYMAPEQCGLATVEKTAAHPVGWATDVYALGAILYELLTGWPPFKAAYTLDTIRQVLHDEPLPPRRLPPATPRDLEPVCLKCLRKDPARRYATAAALADALNLFLAGHPIGARPAGWVERAGRWSRRNAAVASLLGLAALLVLVLAIGSTGAAVLLEQRLRRAEAAEGDLGRSLEEVREAERAKTARLREALIERAAANRIGRRPGQRFGTLRTIGQALELGGPLPELRTEAIAALSLPDLEVLREWEGWPAGTLSVRFDGDLALYARQYHDGTVSIHRAADNAVVARLPGVGQPAGNGAKLSPDGRQVAQYGRPDGRTDGCVALWSLDRRDSAPVGETAADVREAGIAFRPDSQRLAVAQPNAIVADFDTATGRELQRLPFPGRATRLAYHPTLPRLAVAGPRAFKVFDTRGGAEQVDIRLPAPVTALAWHPGGGLLATACEDLRIHIWDAATGKTMLVLEGHSHPAVALAFHPGGQLLLSSDAAIIVRMWELSSGRELLSVPGGVFGFSRDGRYLAAGGLPGSGRLRLYRVATGQEFRTVVPPTSRCPGRFTWASRTLGPHGRLQAMTSIDGVHLIDPVSGQVVACVPTPDNYALQFGASGALLTYGRAGLQRWPVGQGSSLSGRLSVGPPEKLLSTQQAGQWGASADGRVLAIADNDAGAVVRIQDSTRELKLKPRRAVTCCAVSPRGEWVAMGSLRTADGIGAKLWDTTAGRLVSEFALPDGCGVQFSPDGKWLATSGGGCRLRHVGSWEPGPFLGGEWIAFSEDGALAAVSGEFGAMRLVEPATGREYARLEAPEPIQLLPISFTSDGGHLLAFGSQKGTLHIWDLRAIRRQLVELGLDWDLPSISPVRACPEYVVMPRS